MKIIHDLICVQNIENVPIQGDTIHILSLEDDYFNKYLLEPMN